VPYIKNSNKLIGRIKFIDYSKIFSNNILAIQSSKINHKKKSSTELNIVLKNVALSKNDIAIASQIHSDTICWVDKPGISDNCDGLLTKNKIPLFIQTADCAPVFIVDNRKEYYGLIHSGWRGTHKKIVSKAINELIINGSDINDLIIVLGASIMDCCYEVGFDFFQKFNSNSLIKKNDKLYFSNSKQIELDLINIGIDYSQIFISQQCTFGNKDLCSFRRDGNLSGRMFSILMME